MKRSPMPPRKTPLRSSSTLSRRSPLNHVSARRRRDMKDYAPERAKFLAANPRCQFPGGCTQAATDVHHKRGRVGADLLDVTHWAALCRAHHDWVTEHPAQAVEMGMSELRIGGAA